MKKITLAIGLATVCLQAQNFPNPYCDIDPAGTTVEEITSVSFASTTITNSNSSVILIDKTAEVSNVTAGDIFTLTVEGDTKGNFDTDIVAFIDWNFNNIFDDANEVYEIGTLTNSNGSDGVSVSLDIAVPAETISGNTRIRITKTYQDPDSPAEIDPCAIAFNPFGQGVFPGFGQGLDFTLSVMTLGVNDLEAAAVSVYPNPTFDKLYINSTIAIFESIAVTDINGRTVQNSINQASNEINVSSLDSGTYFLHLKTAEGNLVKRFVKQ